MSLGRRYGEMLGHNFLVYNSLHFLPRWLLTFKYTYIHLKTRHGGGGGDGDEMKF